MALERIDLLENLRRLAPALGRDIVPVFACFCFTGKVATAYDDVVALSIPLPWPAPGGFRGDVLLGWLGAARAADVEVTAVEGKEGQALLKCGRSKLNITTLAPKDFVFSPQTDKADTIAITPGLLEMLGRCEVSMGEDPSRTWQNGVTLAFPSGDAPDRVTFYSTNNVAASRGRVKVTIERQTKLVTLLLPPRFVKLMLAIAARDKAKTLHVNKSWAQVDFASGLQLFSRTSRDTDLEAFKGVFNSELEAKAEKLLHEKPKGLEHALERALVLLASTRDKVITLTVKEGELRLEASSALGKVRDVVKFPGHPEVSVECNPEQLAKSLPHIETLGIVGGSCVLLRGSRFTHVISTIQEAAAAPEEEEGEEKGEGKRRAGDADKKGKNRSGN